MSKRLGSRRELLPVAKEFWDTFDTASRRLRYYFESLEKPPYSEERLIDYLVVNHNMRAGDAKNLSFPAVTEILRSDYQAAKSQTSAVIDSQEVSTLPQSLDYLNVELDYPNSLFKKEGKSARFDGRRMAFRLACELYLAREVGRARGQLVTSVWQDRAVQPNNFDQQILEANRRLRVIGVKLVTNARRYRMVEIA